MDEADRAEDRVESDRRAGIERARRLAAAVRPRLAGWLCRNCSEELPRIGLFCDDSCKEDWEHRQQRKTGR